MSISQREYRDVANRQRTGFNDRLPRSMPAAPERHARKCVICNHRDREEIEAAFLCWTSPSAIVSAFHLGHREYIYRHVRATGLDQLRRHKLSCAAEMIVEHASAVEVNARDVLKAVYVVSHIDGLGQWREYSRAAEPRPSSNRHKLVRLETLANA
jgi:hypothetical protein